MGGKRIRVRERRYKNGSRVGVMCLEDRGRGPQTEATSQPLEARKDRGVNESEVYSVVSDSLRPHGIQFMEFSRPEYWSG